MAVIFPIKSTFDPKGVNAAKKSFNGLSATTKSLAKTVLLPTAALGAVAFKFAKAGENAATANARILQINTSMGLFGDATQEVSNRLVKLAEKTALNTGVDQNAIKLTQAKLLTFKELAQTAGIVGGAFDRATAAAVDMAASGFGEASSNAVQLGKALNDPIKGITALNRSGITFTADQKKLIKSLVDSGKTLEAQQIILKAIETQVGGTALATANSSDKMKVAFSLVSEQIGTALLPAFDRIVAFTIDKIIPAVEVFINALTGKQSLSSSFTGAQEKAFVFGNVVRAVIETIVNYQRFIVGFGAALAAMFVIAKVSAAAGALVTIIGGIVKALQTLRTVGVAATIATAFATGGVSALAGAAGAAAAAAAIALAFVGINKVMDNYKENVESLPKIDIAPDTGAGAFQDVVLPTADTSGGGGGGGGSSSANASAAMAKVVATASKAATKALEGMNNALSAARSRLQAARDAYADYKHSVKDAIISQFDFSSALGVFKDRQNTAKDASKRLADAQKEYNEALKSKDVERISDALKELTAAQKDNARATKNNKTFMQTLREQANQAVNFARKVRTLITMGLSQAGIDQVLAAGAEAGTAIADELIAGGANAISETNALLNSVKNAATTIGTSAANAFFQAGITQGQAMVNGIIQAVQAAGFIIKGGTIVLPSHLQKALDAGKLTPAQVTELNAILKGVPKLAEGGIVNKPTLALIGEAGPEAVVPLSKMGGSKSNTYNITVNAGMGTNGGQVGREIVDAIKKYERTNGPVFASA
jgi:hypothetical protein